MNSLVITFVAIIAMASFSSAAIRTDLRARHNSKKIADENQLQLFASQLTGNEVYLSKNDWFNFTIYSKEKDLNIGFKYLNPQPLYENITVKILDSIQEVKEKSDPNISWFVPLTTWYATKAEGPTVDSMNINCMIPKASLMGLYHLTVSSKNENHVNSTNIFLQESEFPKV